jgi:DedD protein
MDRRVKERLIGASILVALIVLVVPELLSGPKPKPEPATAGHAPIIAPEPTRNVTVDLTTSKAPASSEEQVPAANAAPAAASAPAASAPAASTPAASAPAVSTISAPPATSPADSVETAARSPISSARGSWAVQLGSFANRANSEGLVHQLKAQGFSAYVLSGGSGPALRYRVRIGPLADRQSAERMAAKLKSLGHVSSIVTPAG